MFCGTVHDLQWAMFAHFLSLHYVQTFWMMCTNGIPDPLLINTLVQYSRYSNIMIGTQLPSQSIFG